MINTKIKMKFTLTRQMETKQQVYRVRQKENKVVVSPTGYLRACVSVVKII